MNIAPRATTSVEIRASEIALGEIGAVEDRAAELRAGQLGLAEVRPDQRRPGEVGADGRRVVREDAAVELRASKDDAVGLGRDELHAGEVRLRHVDARERDLDESGLGEIGAHEAHAGDVDPEEEELVGDRAREIGAPRFASKKSAPFIVAPRNRARSSSALPNTASRRSAPEKSAPCCLGGAEVRAAQLRPGQVGAR